MSAEPEKYDGRLAHLSLIHVPRRSLPFDFTTSKSDIALHRTSDWNQCADGDDATGEY